MKALLRFLKTPVGAGVRIAAGLLLVVGGGVYATLTGLLVTMGGVWLTVTGVADVFMTAEGE